MISCRYVSSDCSTIGDREFDSVGQRAMFSEQGFREVVLGGAAFVPEQYWKKYGFEQRELDKYGPAGMRIDPPASFCNKLDAAQADYRELRSRIVAEPRRELSEIFSDELVAA